MGTPINVLLIEDSVDDAELIIHELSQGGFTPRWKRVQDKASYVEALKEKPEVILSDFKLPQFSAPPALTLLQESRLDIPFIIVSGTIGEERAVECLKAGATDYVLKDRLPRLVPAIRRALREAQERAERRQVEANLHLQTTALEAAANGILITDPEGRILYVNSSFCDMSGYRPEECIGANPRFLKSGKHDERFYRKLWDTILAGKVWRGEVVNQRKDGSLFQAEMTITPVRGAGGETTHFIAVKQDVSERKAMQQELWLRDQRLSSFFSNATAGLCIVDANLRFLQINETLAAMNGLPVHEHLGRTLKQLFPGFGRGGGAHSRARPEHRGIHAQCRDQRRDGPPHGRHSPLDRIVFPGDERGGQAGSCRRSRGGSHGDEAGAGGIARQRGKVSAVG